MKRDDLVWAATCAVLTFAAAVFGAGRGLSTAWPWLVVGAIAGYGISLALRQWRGQ